MTVHTLSDDEALALVTGPSQDPEVRRVLISPEAAGTLLGANTVNRRINPRRVSMLSRVLRAGNWKLTNDAIVIDANGVLANGQHRLAACVETAVPLDVLLYTGADPAMRYVADTGMKRTMAAALYLTGNTDASNLGAALSLHYRYSQRLIDLDSKRTAGNEALDHATLLDWLRGHPEVNIGNQVSTNARYHIPHVKKSALAVGVALTYLIDVQESLNFYERVVKGEGLIAGEPEYALRGWLIRNSAEADQIRSLAMYLKAWNAKRAGATIRSLSFHPTERMPVAQ